MSSVLLIDAKNALYRHAHVHNHLSREDGFPTGALFGCLNSMISLSKKLPDSAIVWVWDGRGETWRHKFMSTIPQLDATAFPALEKEEDEEELPLNADALIQGSLDWLGMNNPAPVKKKHKRGYKANRKHKVLKKKKSEYDGTPHEKALMQIPILRLVLEGCGIRNYEVDGLEGDDLVGMLARRAVELDKDVRIYIHSGDRDYYQLLAWPQVQIIKNLKDGKLQKVKAKDVYRDYGVKPKNWTKFRALTGDGSDNIPHLKKVGSAIAKKMLAAGLDPSLVLHSEVPDSAKETFARFFQPHGIERMWGAVNGNYKLCKLVTEIDDPLLSKDVRERVGLMFEGITHMGKYYRRKSMKTSESYRKVSFLLSQYELASILGRRDDLWKIP